MTALQMWKQAASLAQRIGVEVGLVRLPDGASILHQLHVEEALYKLRPLRSFLVLHHSAPPAVVLGMSGRVKKDVSIEAVAAAGVPVIRRFSGGGTVFIDRSTLFSSLISTAEFLQPDQALPTPPPTCAHMSPQHTHQVRVFPREVMRWMGAFYGRAFAEARVEEGSAFDLRDNDYVWGQRKFGGNAQRMSSTRWLQHTSFLWDYDAAKLGSYLPLPEKQPAYRQQRTHAEFLCRLRDCFPSSSIERMTDVICEAMIGLGVRLVEVPSKEVEGLVLEAQAAGQLTSHEINLAEEGESAQ